MSDFFSTYPQLGGLANLSVHPNADRWSQLLLTENKAVSYYRSYFRQSSEQPADESVCDAVRRLETMNRIIDVMSTEGIVIPFAKLQRDTARAKTNGRIMVSDFVLSTTIARLQRNIVEALVEISDHLQWEAPESRQVATSLLLEESKVYQDLILMIRRRYLLQ